MTVYGRTGPDGRMTRDVSRSADLRLGDTIELTCLYPEDDLFLALAYAD